MSFDLSRYELQAGTSQQLDLSITLRTSQANIIEIVNPFGNAAIAIESVKRVEAGNSSDYWLTTDSILFAKNLPQTALIVAQKNSITIKTATAVKSSEQLIIRVMMSVPGKDLVKESKGESVKSSNSAEKRMIVNLSHSSSPGSISKYFSAKPVVVKQQGFYK